MSAGESAKAFRALQRPQVRERLRSGRAVYPADLILKNRKSHSVQDLRESATLFEEGASGASVPITLGNIYLLRLSDTQDRAFELIVKLMVIAYTPNESVTIRWQVL